VKAGGVGIPCSCDVVLSSERTCFELGEVLFGLIPANLLPYLLLRVSLQKARYLILTSRGIPAGEALRLNLVDELYAEDKLESGVREVIRRLMRSSPNAIARAKAFTAALSGAEGKEIDRWKEIGEAEFMSLTGNPEVEAGIAAFGSGELPEWFGRFKPQEPLTGAGRRAEKARRYESKAKR
jgi:enoyl-CoA hydratase/carnithine racemase